MGGDPVPYCSRRLARRSSPPRRRRIADHLLERGEIRPGQQPDIVAVVAGDDRILQQRRRGRERGDAQAAGVHPFPVESLKSSLRDVEYDALERIIRVGQPRASPPEKPSSSNASLVRSGRPTYRGTRWGRARHLGLPPAGTNLSVTPGRQADHAGALDEAMAGGRAARGLGRAQLEIIGTRRPVTRIESASSRPRDPARARRPA